MPPKAIQKTKAAKSNSKTSPAPKPPVKRLTKSKASSKVSAIETVLTKGAMRRLARRGGVKRTTALILPEIRNELHKFVKTVVSSAMTYAEHRKRTTVTAMDVIHALRKRGQNLYGYT